MRMSHPMIHSATLAAKDSELTVVFEPPCLFSGAPLPGSCHLGIPGHAKCLAHVAGPLLGSEKHFSVGNWRHSAASSLRVRSSQMPRAVTALEKVNVLFRIALA